MLEASVTARATHFQHPIHQQTIGELEINELEVKGWCLSSQAASSFIQNSASAASAWVIDKYNTAHTTSLSKASTSGLHRITTQYRYVPAGFTTPGNPFLQNDIQGIEFTLNNMFFNSKVNSLAKVDLARNNTLGLLEHTTERINLFAFQQIQLSDALQFIGLSTFLKTTSAETESQVLMNDLSLVYTKRLGKTQLSVSGGALYQSYEIGNRIKQHATLAKGEASLMAEWGKTGIFIQHSLPNPATPQSTTTRASFTKYPLKKRLTTEIGGGLNTVSNLHPRATYHLQLNTLLKKGLTASLNLQKNALYLGNRSFTGLGSTMTLRISQSF